MRRTDQSRSLEETYALESISRLALNWSGIPDVLEFARPRDRVAGPTGLEICDRQRDQMPEQPGAEFDVDPLGGVGET